MVKVAPTTNSTFNSAVQVGQQPPSIKDDKPVDAAAKATPAQVSDRYTHTSTQPSQRVGVGQYGAPSNQRRADDTRNVEPAGTRGDAIRVGPRNQREKQKTNVSAEDVLHALDRDANWLAPGMSEMLRSKKPQ